MWASSDDVPVGYLLAELADGALHIVQADLSIQFLQYCERSRER